MSSQPRITRSRHRSNPPKPALGRDVFLSPSSVGMRSRICRRRHAPAPPRRFRAEMLYSHQPNREMRCACRGSSHPGTQVPQSSEAFDHGPMADRVCGRETHSRRPVVGSRAFSLAPRAPRYLVERYGLGSLSCARPGSSTAWHRGRTRPRSPRAPRRCAPRSGWQIAVHNRQCRYADVATS